MSDPVSPILQPSTIEQLLTSLAGIVSARAVTGAGGDLEEIHVLATAALHPKQIARNIESALSAGLGIEINRRIISIAQLRAGLAGAMLAGAEAAPEPITPSNSGTESAQAPLRRNGARAAATTSSDALEPAADTAGRLIFLGHEVVIDTSRTATCTVAFRMGDAEISGQGTGFDTPQGRAEAAARAVFDAFDRTRKTDRIGLEGVAIVEATGRDCVLVTARPLAGRQRRTLTGAAPIRDSHEEAAILAALQATNHWRSSS